MAVTSTEIKTLLGRLARGSFLTTQETEAVFSSIMQGDVLPTQLAAVLMALRLRGESIEELRGAVKAVRACMKALPYASDEAIDVCGTGGDALGTLNVSTAVAFVMAALEVPVAKHGNRALSSRAGATDTLSALGISPCDDAEAQADRLRKTHLAFLSAPLHHPAMRSARAVREALGFRTIFNLVGPLCNPANVRRQFIGVSAKQWLAPATDTLAYFGARCAWAVHGETDLGGSDEMTLAGPNYIRAWEGDRFLDFIMTPEMAGFERASITCLSGGTPAHNAMKLQQLLEGEKGVYRDTVLLNAAVALHVSGRALVVENEAIVPGFVQRNVARVAEAIDSGRALSVLRLAQNDGAARQKTSYSRS